MSKVIRPVSDTAADNIIQIPDASLPPVSLPNTSQPGLVSQDFADEDGEEYCRKIMQNAQDILDKAQQDAEKFSQRMLIHARKERGEILTAAQSEAENIKKQAYTEGYNAGASRKAADIDEALQSLNQAVVQLTEAQERYFAKYSAALKFLACEIAGKIICRRIEDDDSAVADMVLQAVESVKDVEWVTVEISEKLTKACPMLEREFQKVRPGRPRVEVKKADCDKLTVILRTPDGVLDASVPVQLDNLNEYFRRIDSQPQKD